MKVRELETMNRLLRTQLQDSAASFRAALETAQRYLHEGVVRCDSGSIFKPTVNCLTESGFALQS